jgi:hypothetical protein
VWPSPIGFRRDRTHPLYAERYQATKRRLGRQRGPKVAQIDLSRKLTEAIWNMLTRNQPFAPAGAVGRLVALPGSRIPPRGKMMSASTFRGSNLHENQCKRHGSMTTHPHAAHGGGQSLNRLAFSATVHCLTGCAIGVVLGMILATWWGWGDFASIALAIVLAFFFGYGVTSLPLLRSGMSMRQVAPLAFASDTASIATMEVVDNLIIIAVPGALAAGLGDPLFWSSLAVALLTAGAVAYPLNRWLIARGKGHAVVHAHHGSSH